MILVKLLMTDGGLGQHVLRIDAELGNSTWAVFILQHFLRV